MKWTSVHGDLHGRMNIHQKGLFQIKQHFKLRCTRSLMKLLRPLKWASPRANPGHDTKLGQWLYSVYPFIVGLSLVSHLTQLSLLYHILLTSIEHSLWNSTLCWPWIDNSLQWPNFIHIWHRFYQSLQLSNVFIPNPHANLLSFCQLVEYGYSIIFSSTGYVIHKRQTRKAIRAGHNMGGYFSWIKD